MKKTLLSLSFLAFTIVGTAQNCSELFISEYVEGSGNSKALEIFNPTSSTVNLNNYRIVRYSNGSSTGTDSTDLSTTASVNSYSTYVIANGVGVTSGTTSTSPACAPALQALAQQMDGAYPTPTFMNGDDAIVLVRKNPYARIDIFGKIGEQPATAWSDVAPYDGTVGKWWTKDHSLQRKGTVKQGVTSNPTQFNVTLEWDSLPKDNWSNVGMHTCDCVPQSVNEKSNLVYLKVFPNPSNGNEIAFVSDNTIKTINIINAIGQVVYTKEENNKTVVIKNLGLSSGIYYAIVKNSIGVKTEKIIIK
jgi:hypothetical protein